MGTDYEERTHYLRKSDVALEGERESREWLRSTPKVHGVNRQIKDLQRTGGHNGRKPPPVPEGENNAAS
jgi:hypothetical protein